MTNESRESTELDKRSWASAGSRPMRHTPWWLWLAIPIAVLAICGSMAGILIDRIYMRETSAWAAQGVGQDVANLLIFPCFLVLAYYAARGSLKAFLAWVGLLVYAAYTYAIYAFDVHFGPLFLLYVAVFGLAIWALVGSLASIDPTRVKASFASPGPTRLVSAFLMTVAGGFSLLWLGEDLPAMLGDDTPAGLVDTGLLTNPVHVLDLSVFLPACMLAGVLLRQRRPWGFCLAPIVLCAQAAIGLGIVTLTIVAAGRGEDASVGVAAGIGTLMVAQILLALRLLQGVPQGTRLDAVRRT